MKHSRVYAEEGLARCEVAVWLGDGGMALEHGGRTLSRYDVSLSPGEKKLEAVTNPRLFATPYGTGQPKLFALDALGEGGWLKALELAEYAARAPAAREAATGPVPPPRGLGLTRHHVKTDRQAASSFLGFRTDASAALSPAPAPEKAITL